MTKILEGNNQLLLCRKCGVNPQRLSHTWCLECYHEYKNKWDNNNEEHNKEYKKQWEEEHKGYYLYIVSAKGNGSDIIYYVGVTETLSNRMSSHLNLHSKIANLIESDKWDYIKYIDLSSKISNRTELLWLENFLINLYNTSEEYNSNLNRIQEDKIDKLKMFSLGVELHSIEWKTYITREEYQKSKKNNLSKRQ
ncbi:GIY-YIG nuclease family protein [Clostridium perfringens]|nr:GIY-YIG nuclease family protein [Clostridium perfringens]